MKPDSLISKISLIVLTVMFIAAASPASSASSVMAQKKEYTFYAGTRYEPPPGGHFNVYTPGACVSGGNSEFGNIVIEQLAHYFRLNDTYKPWLATSWEFKDDSFIVHLRQGVTWSDGTFFTSKDVVSTFLILKLQNHILWQYVDDVKAIDDYTVSFHVKVPSYLIKYYVLTQGVTPYSIYGEYSDKVPGATADQLASLLMNFTRFRPNKYIGTGPYVLKSITTSQQVYVKRNDYWAELQGLAKIYWDKFVVVRYTSDPNAAQLELAGAIWYDESGGFVKGQMEEAPKHFNCTFAIHPLFSGPAIYFNLKRYPLNIKEVRQAICYAINKTMATAAGYPISVPIARQTGFSIETCKLLLDPEVYNSLTDYSYNLTKAEELLKSAGFKRGSDGIWVSGNGTKLEFEWLIPGGWATGRVATQASAQLAEFGIKTTIKAVEPSTCYENLQRGTFEMLNWFWGGGLPYPWFGAEIWTYDYMPFVTGYPGPGFPTTYEWPPGSGKYVNVTEEALKLNLGYDLTAQKERVELLAKIFSEYLPFIATGQKKNPVFISYEGAEWPPIYFPDGTARPWTYAYEGNLGWLIIHGLVRPKGLGVVTPSPAEIAAKTALEAAKSAANQAAEASANAKAALEAAQAAQAAAEAAKAAAEAAASNVWMATGIIAIIVIIMGIAIMMKRPS